MALSYTYLFDSIRQYIMAANTLEGWMGVYDDAEAAINGTIATAGEYDKISGVPESFVQRKDALVSTIGQFSQSVNSLLTDTSLCAGFLPIPATTSVSAILPALFHQMLVDDETLAASVVTVGSPAAVAGNVGDATLFADGTLDGATAPHSGWPALRDYAIDTAGKFPGDSGGGYVGRLSELTGGDTFRVVCSRDSQTDKVAEGTESFDLFGSSSPNQPYDWRSDGSGSGGALAMANGSGLLTNGEFETWASYTPPIWATGTAYVLGQWVIPTAANGHYYKCTTAGTSGGTQPTWPTNGSTVADGATLIWTDEGTTAPLSATGWTLGTGAFWKGTVLQEVTNIKRGLYSLQALGTGASTIAISQSKTTLTPLKRYLVSVWVKTSGAGVAAGTLTISFTGTGYVAASTEKISLAHAALAALTSYTLESFWVTMPQSIPTDMALTVSVTGTLTAGEKIYLDGMVLAPATYFGGLAFAIVAGATPVLRGDSWTCAVTTVEGGVQRFFRKVYHVQLPSLTAASTITDTVTVFS